MKKIACILFLFTINLLAQEKVKSSEAYQEDLNVSFADSLRSPLTKEDRDHFKGLDFFPVDKKFVVKARFVKAKRQKSFEMKTTTDRKPLYIKYGELHFSIDSTNLVLNVYKNIELSTKKGFADYLFLPFSDLSNGKESYIGGRFLDMTIPKSTDVLIDFNKAYNPYCAYNFKYSCPIVPLENDLPIVIHAGVKKFHD